MKLSGKVAIVTGSGRGIGKAIATLLAREGARVVIDDIDVETMGQTVNEINKAGGTAIGCKADVSIKAEVQNLAKTALDKFGQIHILVNNAGITRHGPLVELAQDDWDSVINTDLKGVFNCIQAIAPHMIQKRYGKIVNISSGAGVGNAREGMAAYGAAKAGVAVLTHVAARELGPHGINVNAIAPGAILTQLTYTRRNKEEMEKFIEERKISSVIGRLGQPEDIANLALFLVLDDSSFITGQIISCDGGRADNMRL